MADKVWFKIGETARLVGATPKELRYWEKVIPELRPRRSKGNLRYYHQEELARLQRIRQWLAEGLSVADCSQLLQGQPAQQRTPPPEVEPRGQASSGLQVALRALRALHRQLSGKPADDTPVEVPVDPPQSRSRRKARQAPVSGAEEAPSLECEAPLLTEELVPEGASVPDSPPAKRARKPKPESAALGRMWSEGRLPLDWED